MRILKHKIGIRVIKLVKHVIHMLNSIINYINNTLLLTGEELKYFDYIRTYTSYSWNNGKPQPQYKPLDFKTWRTLRTYRCGFMWKHTESAEGAANWYRNNTQRLTNNSYYSISEYGINQQ